MRFDLLPVVTYTWRRRRRPLRIPTPGSNARVAVCGPYRCPRGPFVFSHGGRSGNTSHFVEMVTLLGRRARRTGRRIVLVLDNGSAHTSKRSTEVLTGLEGCLRVFWLPPYSSEQLNDIEPLWKRMKEDYFSRMLVKKRDRFERAAVALLRTFRAPGALRRLLRVRRTRRGCAKLVRVA